MKKYTLALVGTNKTGTTTIWDALKNHPQISTSVKKELLMPNRDHPIHENVSEEYVDKYFNIMPKTKILLDGTPRISTRPRYVEVLKKIKKINKIVCLFTLRDPLEVAYSACIMRSKIYYRHLKTGREINVYYLISPDKVNYDALEKFVSDQMNIYHDINNAVESLGFENILFVPLDEIHSKSKEICNFFKIDEIDIHFDHLNKAKQLNLPFKFLRQMVLIKDWFNTNNDRLLKVQEDQKKKVFERYGITW